MTGIEFKKGTASQATLTSHIFATQFDEENYIEFSKKRARLPLTQFRIDLDTPCLSTPSALSLNFEE